MTIAVVALTLLSIAAYWLVGFSKKSRARNETQYFIADQTVSMNDYANVSVAYALQMAALFLFAYWGFLYGIGALWTALFWFFGYVVLYVALPKFQQYRAEASSQTLHSFIRKQFSSAKGLQKLAAIATIVGLMGTMLTEVGYTVQVYQPALSRTPPILLELVFLGFGIAYVIWNGYKAEVNTERVQLPMAYIGLLVVLFAAFPQVYVHAGSQAFWIITAGAAVSLSIMAVGKLFDVESWRLKWFNWQAAIPLVALVALIIESSWVHLHLRPGSANNVFNQPLSTQLLGLGVVGLISLLIANALWMPVDASTWQRVGSVSGSDNAALVSLRRGTFRVMLESPAGWCLGAVLGWTISAGGYVPANYSDPYSIVAAFAAELYNGNVPTLVGAWHYVLYPIFVASCAAIMVSTVTSILSAVSMTADRDLFPDYRDNLAWVRGLSIILVVVGLGVYETLRAIFQANLPTLLYGAYSAQLSLFVVTMLALYQRRLNAHAAFLSIVIGLACTALSVTVAIMKPAQVELAVLPPLFAVLGSAIAYLIGYQVIRTPSSSDHATTKG